MNRNTGWYPTGSPTSPPPPSASPWPVVGKPSKPWYDERIPWLEITLIVIAVILIAFLWAKWNQPSTTDTNAVISTQSGETPAAVTVQQPKEATVIVEVPMQDGHEPCPSNWGQLTIEELNMLTGGECTVYIE